MSFDGLGDLKPKLPSPLLGDDIPRIVETESYQDDKDILLKRRDQLEENVVYRTHLWSWLFTTIR